MSSDTRGMRAVGLACRVSVKTRNLDSTYRDDESRKFDETIGSLTGVLTETIRVLIHHSFGVNMASTANLIQISCCRCALMMGEAGAPFGSAGAAGGGS